MLELLAVFLVTFVVITGLFLALTFGKVPAYRPTRQSVLALMQRVAEGERDPRHWDLFLGMPIPHDEELETIRRACVEYHEGLTGSDPAPAGLDGEIYDRAGRARVAELARQLEQVIEDAPVTREF